jgi:nucleotide-binding universal stress UspA family protein
MGTRKRSGGGFRRVVLGVDGSPHSRRAAAFLRRLAPGGGRVTVVRVVEPVRAPAMPLVPNAVRAQIAGQAEAMNRSQTAAAQRMVDNMAAELTRAGWRARGVTRTGVPLAGLLAAVRDEQADLLVLGARGAGAVTHFLLGSVAEAALKHSPVEVLIVK